MDANHVVERAGAIVRREWTMVGLRQVADPPGLGDSSYPGRVYVDYPHGASLEQFAVGVPARQRLRRHQRYVRSPGELGQLVHTVCRHRVFVPHWLKRVQCFGYAYRRRQAPAMVQLDANVHIQSHGVTYVAERLQALVYLCRRDVLRPIAAFYVIERSIGILVERPNLHCRDPHVEQRLGQLGGPSLLPAVVVVLVGATNGVAVSVTDTYITGACVVELDSVAHRSAQQSVDRQPHALSEYVPEGDVDGRKTAHLCANSPVSHPAKVIHPAQRRVVPLNSDRILA